MAETKHTYTYALGRRRSSVARVRLSTGKGKITINENDGSEYFAASGYLLSRLNEPFKVLDLDSGKYDISVRVSGGGHSGQADAIRLGIAKALAMNEDYKGTLKRADLLGRDPREKERKHFGLRKARKQRQFTKR